MTAPMIAPVGIPIRCIADEWERDEVEGVDAATEIFQMEMDDDPLVLGDDLNTYFEVTEYDDAPACGDTVSTCDSTSSVGFGTEPPPSPDEQTLPGEQCLHWPVLLCSTSPGTPSSLNERASFGPTELLSFQTPPLQMATPTLATAPAPSFMSRGAWGSFLFDEALERRYTAALVLTGGLSGLPALPQSVARLVLDEALHLGPWLSHFALTAHIDVASTLMARRIDISNNKLKSNAADLIGWMMRQSRVLQSLDVSGNALGVRGGVCIGRALPHAIALRTLRLNDASLCSSGACPCHMPMPHAHAACECCMRMSSATSMPHAHATCPCHMPRQRQMHVPHAPAPAHAHAHAPPL